MIKEKSSFVASWKKRKAIWNIGVVCKTLKTKSVYVFPSTVKVLIEDYPIFFKDICYADNYEDAIKQAKLLAGGKVISVLSIDSLVSNLGRKFTLWEREKLLKKFKEKQLLELSLIHTLSVDESEKEVIEW